MRKVTVTYHLRNMLHPRSIDETCVDIPVKDEVADDLVQPTPSIRADEALRLLSTICDSLALLQGYDESEIVDIRFAQTRNEA